MKPIPNNENYLVTTEGKIYSTTSRHGERLEPRLITDWSNRGYRQVRLYKNSTRKSHSVHRLVALTYIANPHSYEYVNHIDGNKANNNVENLEWCTASQNSRHNYKIGLQKALKGEAAKHSKLTSLQVAEIRTKYIPRKYSQAKLAIEYGLAQQTVSDILTNKIWVQ